MERRTSKTGGPRGKPAEGELRQFSYISHIKKIVENIAHSDIDSDEKFFLYLRSWWSRTYSRPLKDPLLDEYTPEELYYEYCDHSERIKAAENMADEASDKIEDDKFKDAMDWAEEEELRELEELKKNKQKEWMKKELEKNKEELGEDFGEDLSLDFTEI